MLFVGASRNRGSLMFWLSMFLTEMPMRRGLNLLITSVEGGVMVGAAHHVEKFHVMAGIAGGEGHTVEPQWEWNICSGFRICGYQKYSHVEKILRAGSCCNRGVLKKGLPFGPTGRQKRVCGVWASPGELQILLTATGTRRKATTVFALRGSLSSEPSPQKLRGDMAVALLLGFVSMLFSGFGTIVGFGGGVFMVPVMVVAFGIKITYAIGAVTLALFPAALISTVHNWRENLVDPVAGIWLETPTILGTILGAWLTSKLSVTWLEIVFSLFLSYVAARMYRKHSAEAPPSRFVTRLNGLGPVLKRERYGSTYTMAPAPRSFSAASPGPWPACSGSAAVFSRRRS